MAKEIITLEVQSDIGTVAKETEQLADATKDAEKGFKGIDRREGYVTGYNNYLFPAINLALNWGYKEIDIYGADMCLIDGYSHFYSTEVADARARKVYNRVFHRCRTFKQSFMIQKEDDEVLNWINEQPEQFFNGACLIEDK